MTQNDTRKHYTGNRPLSQKHAKTENKSTIILGISATKNDSHRFLAKHSQTHLFTKMIKVQVNSKLTPD